MSMHSLIFVLTCFGRPKYTDNVVAVNESRTSTQAQELRHVNLRELPSETYNMNDEQRSMNLNEDMADSNVYNPHSNFDENSTPYNEILPPLSYESRCEYCGALLWVTERHKKKTPCCANGKIHGIQEPNRINMYRDQVARGQYILNACDEQVFQADMNWYMSSFRSDTFADASRKYVLYLDCFIIHNNRLNALFAYTSIGTNEQHLPPGPPAYKIRGQLIHNIGAFEPTGSAPRSYAQIYVLDSDKQEELRSNMAASFHFDREQMAIAQRIQTIMTRHNGFAKK